MVYCRLMRNSRFLLRMKSRLFWPTSIPSPLVKLLSISVGPSDGEQRLGKILQNEFHPTELEVRDISGGCGSMYQIGITSEKFKGTRLVQQHRMVKDVLKEEVEKMHGYTLITSVPS